MANKRNFPRFKNQEKIEIFSIEDNKLVTAAETVDISVKGISFESEASLDINAKYVIYFGCLRGKKVKALMQIIAQYFKGTKQCFSAIFIETDLLKKNEIRSYVEAVRAGKPW
ncbi:MAG: PilZ domain-containing protein [Elusimicrobia bacterium]|nr:PilZ domain-containing protein [Elusimicrobiota bacterium]